MRINSDEINQFTGYAKRNFEKFANMVLYFIEDGRTFTTRLEQISILLPTLYAIAIPDIQCRDIRIVQLKTVRFPMITEVCLENSGNNGFIKNKEVNDR